MNENSTSHVFISEDYGSTFTDISSKFLLTKDEETQATINKLAKLKAEMALRHEVEMIKEEVGEG